MKKLFYTWEEMDRDCRKILKIIKFKGWNIKGIYGIPKGGLPLAVMLANHLGLPLFTALKDVVTKKNLLIVDDISDKGDTLFQLPNIMNHKVVTLFSRYGTKFTPTYYANYCSNEWIVFPWEPKNKESKRDGTVII